MKRFLFVVDKFYPDVSANTICCENVLKYFISKGHSVDVLAIKRTCQDKDVSFYNGIRIFKLDTYHFYWAKKFKKDDWLKIPTIARKTIGAYNKIKSLFNPLALKGYLDTVNVNKLYKIIKKEVKEQYDGMLSFTEPFALQPICRKLMKKGLAKKWCTYMLDPFEYNTFHNKVSLKKRIKIANSVFSFNSKIFASDGVLIEGDKKGYKPVYADKIVKTHLPVLTGDLAGEKPNFKEINLVYSGTFYSDIRPPEKMLEVLKNFPKEFLINFYGKGCEEVVQQYAKEFKNGNLVINGFVAREESIQKVKGANVLINLGNLNTPQVPSKVLEYIGSGKPIVNFYFSNEDTSLEIFKKYPLVYNFNLENYSNEDVDNLIAFCKENALIQLSYEKATEQLEEFKIENLAQLVLENLT